MSISERIILYSTQIDCFFLFPTPYRITTHKLGVIYIFLNLMLIYRLKRWIFLTIFGTKPFSTGFCCIIPRQPLSSSLYKSSFTQNPFQLFFNSNQLDIKHLRRKTRNTSSEQIKLDQNKKQIKVNHDTSKEAYCIVISNSFFH